MRTGFVGKAGADVGEAVCAATTRGASAQQSKASTYTRDIAGYLVDGPFLFERLARASLRANGTKTVRAEEVGKDRLEARATGRF
jgi:hypothetical protein